MARLLQQQHKDLAIHKGKFAGLTFGTLTDSDISDLARSNARGGNSDLIKDVAKAYLAMRAIEKDTGPDNSAPVKGPEEPESLTLARSCPIVATHLKLVRPPPWAHVPIRIPTTRFGIAWFT